MVSRCFVFGCMCAIHKILYDTDTEGTVAFESCNRKMDFTRTASPCHYKLSLRNSTDTQ